MTNKHNLPLPLVLAIDYTNGRYVKHGDYSVTELFDPPRKIALQRKHPGVYAQEDVIDHLWALFGTAVHNQIARSVGAIRVRSHHRDGFLHQPQWASEFALHKEFGGKVVAGHPDLYDVENRILYDFKVTSLYAIKDGPKEDWKRQLQTYACMIPDAGFPKPERLVSVAILRDWMKKQAARHDYPDCQVAMFEVENLDCKAAAAMVAERVRLHEEARAAVREDREPPECSPEERWHWPGKVAVMKRGRKSAVRLLDTMQEAEDYAAGVKGPTYLQERPSEDKRCADYCLASSVCSQWKAIQERNAGLEKANG